ncbi:MAG: efflux transporter periplasmic adaptor subunit, partial [Ignavibacteriae bacterium HGW-Ignavibacteriae-3]
PQATLVANIVDISRLKVKLNLAESDAFLVKVGDAVNVTVDVYPGVNYKGRVESVSYKGDDAHTYPVEIRINNESAHPLKAGMFARVEFTSLKSRETLVIPRESLVGSIKQPQIYVVENGIAKLRNLTVGDQSGIYVQILGGLMEGETIVVNGQNNLVDNLKVEILNK